MSLLDRFFGGGGGSGAAQPSRVDAQLVERLVAMDDDEFRRYAPSEHAGRHHAELKLAVTRRREHASRALEPQPDRLVFHLGEATGLLGLRNHSAAMKRGEAADLSQFDLFENLAVVGAPGSGKSRAILQPLVYDWMRHPTSGMVAFGVKRSWARTLRSIARQFRRDSQIHTIGPGADPMSLLLGLSPDAVAYFSRTAFDLHARGQGHHQFFTDSASNSICAGAMILDSLCAGGIFIARLPAPNGEGDMEHAFSYAIPSIYEMVYMDDATWNAFEAQARERALQLNDAGRSDLAEQISDGLRTFHRELLTQATDTKNGIKGQIATVFSPFVINRTLRKTFCGSEEFDFTCLDRSESILVDVDVQEFPVAAELAYLLVFQHLAGAAQRREGAVISNPVLLLLDEYTRIAEIRQADLFQTARGAAIACVIAYQSQARMNHVLGGAIGGEAVLGTFRNLIAFSADEPMLKILQTLTGKAEVLRESRTRQRGRSMGQPGFGITGSAPSSSWSESTASNVVERSVVDAQIFRSLERSFRDKATGAPLPTDEQYAQAVAVLSINQVNKDDVIVVHPWDPEE